MAPPSAQINVVMAACWQNNEARIYLVTPMPLVRGLQVMAMRTLGRVLCWLMQSDSPGGCRFIGRYGKDKRAHSMSLAEPCNTTHPGMSEVTH